jgi:hypothetical protein
METAALRRGLTWQTATVTSVTSETATVSTIALDPPAWPATGPGSTWTCG